MVNRHRVRIRIIDLHCLKIAPGHWCQLLPERKSGFKYSIVPLSPFWPSPLAIRINIVSRNRFPKQSPTSPTSHTPSHPASPWQQPRPSWHSSETHYDLWSIWCRPPPPPPNSGLLGTALFNRPFNVWLLDLAKGPVEKGSWRFPPPWHSLYLDSSREGSRIPTSSPDPGFALLPSQTL